MILPPPPVPPKVRKHLSADALYRLVRKKCRLLEDQRQEPSISLGDAMMSAFALFALKDPSLLFEEQDALAGSGCGRLVRWRTVAHQTKSKTKDRHCNEGSVRVEGVLSGVQVPFWSGVLS